MQIVREGDAGLQKLESVESGAWAIANTKGKCIDRAISQKVVVGEEIPELVKFLQIAIGSASELEYHLLLAHELKMLILSD